MPRLRGGLPWREEADFDTFYMAFRFELGGVVFVGGGVGYSKGAVGGVGAFDTYCILTNICILYSLQQALWRSLLPKLHISAGPI